VVSKIYIKVVFSNGMRGRVTLALFGLLVFGMLCSVGAVSLIVDSPADLGKHGDREVLFDLSADEVSDFYYTKVTGGQEGRWVQLCRDVIHCEEGERFSEGSYSILVKAVGRDENVDVEGPINFEIDSKKPRIVKTTPSRNSFVNESAEFVVKYTEDNLENITLYYGDDGMLTKTDCESGRNKECIFEVSDLSDVDGQYQEYWFEIWDRFGNYDSSKKVDIKVDTTLPEELYSGFTVNKRRVSFVFDIFEENFKEISYFDEEEINPSWQRLCSSLRDGLCSKSKTFRPGDHTLKILVEDEAGNTIEFEPIQFSTD
jgi:hypothetical protein